MIHLTLRDLRTLRPSTTQPAAPQSKERRPKRQVAGQSARTQLLPRRATNGAVTGPSAGGA